MQKQKKGIMLNQAFGAVLTLVLVALLIIIAIYLVSSLQVTMRTPGTTATAVNESITSSLTAGFSVNLDANRLANAACGSITAVYNGTGGAAIQLANFTQTGCTLKNATVTSQWGTTLLVNYPYTYSMDTAAANASGTIITQFAAYPTLIGLVGTIIFLALVIGVLVASFAFGGKQGV